MGVDSTDYAKLNELHIKKENLEIEFNEVIELVEEKSEELNLK